MTTKADFTTEEWNDILEAPMTAAMYIIMASPSLFGSIKETFSVAKSIAVEAQKSSQNELLGDLLAEFKDKEATKEAQPEFSSKDPAVMKKEASQALEAVVAVLDEKATPEESSGIQTWLYQLAVNTANASKEGGFLGIGAVRVSDTEKTALEELASVFHVDVDSENEAPDEVSTD